MIVRMHDGIYNDIVKQAWELNINIYNNLSYIYPLLHKM